MSLSVVGIVTAFLYFTYLIEGHQAAWNSPPFSEPYPINNDVEFKGYNSESKRTNINLKEEVPDSICIAHVNYQGNNVPQIGTLEDGKSNFILGAELRKNSLGWDIYITKRQDYETQIMQDYRFGVVIDNEQYQIALNIINIDDNAPVIQANERTCSVEENFSGFSKCTYSISDADGWIDQVKVSISSTPNDGSNNFRINSDYIIGDENEYKVNGYLNVITPLDFETIPMYMLHLNATDGAGNRGNLMTVVQVIDMPDEPPRWTRITAAENILEKTSHQFYITAIDGDVQINAEINYRIIPEIETEKEYFKIEQATGIVIINPIDRDYSKKEIFSFTIVAYEKDDSSSSIHATIIVIVEDINDHVPAILPEKLDIDMNEETYMSLEFDGTIVINDPDLAENGQYLVSLMDDSIHHWSSAFIIVPDNGYQAGNFTITVKNASLLDYENENWRNMEIEIRAIEIANKSHIGRKKIKINLINWNDELPVFEEDAVEIEIKEDVEIGHSIWKMLAIDRDIDDHVMHSIISQKVLMIDEETGQIVTAQNDALDYESIPIVVAQVVATDLANHKAYATLTIKVGDVNDVPPKLYLPKQIPSLIEEVKIGSYVNAKIVASDLDTEAKLLFSIDWDSTTAHKSSVLVNEKHYREHLGIHTEYPDNHTRDAEGKLVVEGRIDYEAFDVIFLTIIVTDLTTVHNDNMTFASLTLNIIDINDNSPEFNKIEDMSVNENQLSETLIGSVTAKDADGPQFNNVSYYVEAINDTEIGLVKIDKFTGIIKVDLNGRIDAEKYEYIYYNVTASDGDNNQTIPLAIYIVDMNDEVPHLLTDEFNSTKHIMEKSPSGTEIFQIYARDKDRTYPFNNVSYLINTNYSAPFQYFNLNRFGGLLLVQLADNSILDRDFGAPSYTLNIKLRDNYLIDGITWNTNDIDMIITVILDDINDQIPELPNLGNPARTITENTKENSSVLTIVAQDHDDPSTDNTKVIYKLVNQTRTDGEIVEGCQEPFRIENEDLTRAHVFADKNLKGCYGIWALQLYAEDKGKNPGPQNDTRIYHIQIADYNYHDPAINVPIEGTTIALSQEQSLHTRLKTHDKRPLPDFKATDEDNGASGSVKFSISSLTGDDKYFEIMDVGENLARIQLNSWPPNIIEKDRYNIKLIVTDSGDPPRSISQEHTIIFVSSLGPKFSHNKWMIWIKENKIGRYFSVLIPEAHDNINEVGMNIVPIYYFVDDKVGDFEFFDIYKSNGNLTVKQELDRETKEIMWINVITTADSEGPPRDPRKESILNITIIVLDENDNPPIFQTQFYFGGVAMEDAVDKVVLTVEATDADINDTLTYSSVEGNLITSDESISGISNPFSLDTNTGELFLKFSVTSDMKGFFKFSIVVNDAVGHNDTAIIQVYLISQTQRVVFTFRNSAAFVKEKKMVVIDVFSDTFGYLCNIDDIRSSVDANGHVLDNITTMTSHFIDSVDNLPIASDVVIRLSSDLQTVTTLKASLQAKGLYLIDVPTGSSSESGDPQETIHWILVLLTIFFGLCTIALLAIYFIRTRSLLDRLDKMALQWESEDQFGKKDRRDAVPGTNQFALAGSNPMWNTMKSRVNRLDDDISQKSGDSDLLGIEDNINFEYRNDAFATEKEFEAKQSGMRSSASVLYFQSNHNNDEHPENKC